MPLRASLIHGYNGFTMAIHDWKLNKTFEMFEIAIEIFRECVAHALLSVLLFVPNRGWRVINSFNRVTTIESSFWQRSAQQTYISFVSRWLGGLGRQRNAQRPKYFGHWFTVVAFFTRRDTCREMGHRRRQRGQVSDTKFKHKYQLITSSLVPGHVM